MQRIPLYIICVMMATVIGSCRPDAADRSRLCRAEAILDSVADHALLILDSIDAGRLSGQWLARYHLALADVRYRLDIIPNNADSLLDIPVDYYKLHTSNPRRYRAYWLRADNHERNQRYTEAILDLLNAEQTAALCSDSLALGLTYRSLNSVFYNIEDYASSFHYARKSFEIFRDIGATRYDNYALFAYASSFNNSLMIDSAAILFRACADLAHERGDSYLESFTRAFLGKAYYNCGKIDSAICILESLFHDFPGYLDGAESHAWRSLGQAYVDKGRLADARECADSLDKYNPDDKMLRYRIACAENNYVDAFNNLQHEMEHQNNSIRIMSQRDFATIIDGYYKQEQIIARAEISRRNRMLAALAALCTMIVAASVAIYVTMKRRRRREMDENVAALAVLEENLRQSELALREAERTSSDTLATLRQHAIAQMKARIKDAEILCRDYHSVTDSNSQLQIYHRITDVLGSIKVGSDSLRDLEAWTDMMMDGVMEKFRRDYPELTERDYALFLFLILGFSTNMCCISQRISTSNLYTMKTRLKAKIMARPDRAAPYMPFFGQPR